MGSWGTAIRDSDSFADVYHEFFDKYNKGGKPDDISKEIMSDYAELLNIEEEKNDFWFALALAQWETKSLDNNVLLTVENIIESGADLILWKTNGVTEKDLQKRKIALDKFLQKLKSDRPRPKTRVKTKVKTAIFMAGDCLTFKLKNGNYGGAVVIEADKDAQSGCNLIATTRLNQREKPVLDDFRNAEVIVKSFGGFWFEETQVYWHMPDFYYTLYLNLNELIGNLDTQFEYDNSNPDGRGYLFRPSITTGWDFAQDMDLQLEHELSQSKPTKKIYIKQLTKNGL